MSSESDDSFDTKPKKWRSADVKTVENVQFSSLLLSEPILQGLKYCGFEKPSPVQLRAIPLGRCGLDLVVQAKSGTGKTCVLAVVALDSLIVDSPSTQVLVLAPTREIAVQICDVVTSLGCAFPGLTCETFIGGLPLSVDKAKLPNCQIAVGTPGRVKQLIDMEHLRTDSVRLFVVDEADRLFDRQFKEDINWIFSSLPSRKQILALSATYPDELSKFLALYMENPAYVRINSEDPSLLGITQYFRSVPFHPLPQVTDCAKFDILLDILSIATFTQCMIFCQRQTKAQDLADNLVLKGFPTLGICSALDQVRRLEIIHELKAYQCRVLVSTDLTARGIDAENVDLVINFDMPTEGEIYLHRIGRAGRYGTRGVSISLTSTGDEMIRLKSFQKKFRFRIYQLPDPVPSHLLDMSVELAASLPEEQENGHVSVDDHTVPENPVAEKQPIQPVEVNHSNVLPDSLERNVPEISFVGSSLESNGATLQNDCYENNHSSPVLEMSKVVQNDKDELINSEKKTDKIYKSEVVNLDNSITEGEPEKQNEHQFTSEVENNKVEFKIATDDVVRNAFNTVIQSEEQMMGISCEINTSDENSSLIFNTSSCTPGLFSVGLDVSEADGFDNVSKNEGEKNLSEEKCVFDPVTLDNTKNMGLVTEYNCDSKIIANLEDKAQSFKIESLFQNSLWEKHTQSDETSDFSGKEISNILLPLLSSNKTKYCKSDLSYNKLVDCLEPCNEDLANDPTEHHLESCLPSSTDVTEAQLAAIQKFVLHDRSEFLSHVQKKFSELRADPVPSETKEANRNPNHSSVDEKPDIVLDDDQVQLQSASISQSGDALSCGTVVVLDQAENELQIEDKNSSKIKPTPPKNKNADTESVKTVAANTISPVAIATEPLLKTDRSRKELRPLGAEKSVGFVKAGAAASKNNDSRFNRRTHNLTEADYSSVSRGLKECRIVPLPSAPCDSPRNESFGSVKDGAPAHSSNQEPKAKNERRGTWKSEKLKPKENYLHSTSRHTSGPSFLDRSRVTAKDDASSYSSYRETETQCKLRENVSGHASTSHFAEQNANYKKKEKVKLTEHKNKRNFPDHLRSKMNLDSFDQNPADFTNGMNDRVGHSDFCETSYQNRSSDVMGTKHASRPSPNRGMHSCCVNVPRDNRLALQYGCCCRPRPQFYCCCRPRPQYDCCCRPSHILPYECYLRPPIPFQNTSPEQYYYKKYLELWYYIQDLTYGHRHH